MATWGEGKQRGGIGWVGHIASAGCPVYSLTALKKIHVNPDLDM